MDFLNNANTIISILVGLFGLGGYLVGITAYLRHKVTSSQQQILQRQPARRNVPQAPPKQLNWMDWMQVLWNGFLDLLVSYGGNGAGVAFMILLCGGMIGGFIAIINPTAGIIYLAISGTIFFTFIILAYVYFVGRRVEQKVEQLNPPQASQRII